MSFEIENNEVDRQTGTQNPAKGRACLAEKISRRGSAEKLGFNNFSIWTLPCTQTRTRGVSVWTKHKGGKMRNLAVIFLGLLILLSSAYAFERSFPIPGNEYLVKLIECHDGFLLLGRRAVTGIPYSFPIAIRINNDGIRFGRNNRLLDHQPNITITE